MKDGTTYPRNTALAILLGGMPGAGKTNLCMEFPAPYFIDADHNLRNAVERHPGKKFTYDDPELSADEKPLELEWCWERLEKLIKENAPKPEVGTIVLDGIGRITDYLKAHLCRVGSQAEKVITVGGVKVMNQSLWQPYADLLKKLIFLCRFYGKPFVLTTHLTVEENELSAVKEQRVLIQGALKADFPKLFTDFWMCDATPSSDARYKAANGVRYFVRTAPTHRILLKQSCGLPAEFEPHDACFTELLKKLGAPA
jgi:adenylate kinase family enzyme